LFVLKWNLSRFTGRYAKQKIDGKPGKIIKDEPATRTGIKKRSGNKIPYLSAGI